MLAAVLAVVGSQAQAQSLSLNFDTPGQYTGNFLTAANITESSTAGVNDSGGLVNNGAADANSIYNASSWDFSQVGDSITLSLMAQIASPIGSSGGTFQMGLGINSSFVMAGSSASSAAFGSFRLSRSSSGASGFKIGPQYDGGGILSSSTVQSAAFQLTPGDWYQFNVVLVDTSSSSYSMTATLYDYGTTGLSPVTGTDLLAAYESGGDSMIDVTGASGAALVAATAAAPGWRVGTATSGISALDNFSVVEPAPEPQSLVLLGFSALLGIKCLKRKI
ncbi:MAG TPA: hypothetical protein VGN23_14035 [Verrucomicrobiae bacterium]